jgi:hypothetical protein
MRTSPAVLMVLALMTGAGTSTGVAQTLEMVRGPGGYGAFGLGGGSFKLTCDSGCTGNNLSGSDVALMFGRQLGGRVRAELGIHVLRNSATSSTLLVGSAGAAVYLLGNLYVRGGATYLRADVEDSSRTFKGNGGPGFTVGAGYEFFLGDQLALTPYVNYASGTISKLDRTVAAVASGTVSGSASALNFGLTIGRSARRPYVCVTAAGTRVRRNPRDYAPFQSCLREVEARLLWEGERVIKR